MAKGKKKGKKTGLHRSSKGQSGTATKAEKEEKQERLTPGRLRAVYGFSFLALAIFTLICIFAPSSAGFVGRGVKVGLAWALGLGRFVLPFIFLAVAGFTFWKKPGLRIRFLAVGLTIMAVSLLALIHVHIPTSSMFEVGKLYSGGGLIGAAISWPMVKLVGTVGAYVFTIAALAVGLVVAFEEQLVSILKAVRERRGESGKVTEAAAGDDAAAPPGREEPAMPKGVKVYPSSPAPAVTVREEKGGQLAINIKSPKAGKYRLPPVSILNRTQGKAFSRKSNEERKRTIEQTLSSMDVDARVVKVSQGPTVSLFEVEVGSGEKVRRVTELEPEIAYALGSPDIRIYSPIPGRQAIGIEVPNHIRDTVLLGDIIDRLETVAPHNLLTVAIGKDMSGEPVILDIAQLPHLLLAGSTGAGKSCCINAIVCSLLFRCRPDQLRLIMIDPKYVEFTWYNGMPHLLCEVINEPEPASKVLIWAVREMDRRYQELQRARVVHIDDYNALAGKVGNLEPMPKVIIVIDELGDLMIVARREVESSISRLTAKARAVGIHMIIATQRPSVDVITGVIKNNITARIAFQVASHADSRTILQKKGAEKLQGKGDMLLDPGNIPQPVRVQGALIQTKEIELLTGYIREEKFEAGTSKPIDLQEVEATVKEDIQGADTLLEEAAEFVVYAGEASASMLQTHLRVGYARARRIIVELADLGIVGPHEGSRSRKVLISPEELEGWKEKQKERP
ncbi:MAG: DNA translocase FtsK [Actinobacteria bacterium]|nr:DNA translocase FtsK [Actinomycetota bacterium]